MINEWRDYLNQTKVYRHLNPNMFKHYKGGTYEVLYVAKHTETDELMVVYRSLDWDKHDQIWIRPYDMFKENVEYNGKEVPRFKQMYNE